MNTTSFFVLVAGFWGAVFSQYVKLPRMIGGEPAEEGSLPFVASVKQLQNEVLVKSCLGSLIDNQWILTSALCVLGGDPTNIIVDFGTYVHRAAPSSRHSRVSRVIVHPGFNSQTGKNDIALIQLKAAVRYTSNVKPIQLGDLKSELDSKVKAVGWNENPEEGLAQGIPKPYHLGIAVLDLLEIGECRKKFPELNKLVDFDGTQICAYNGKGKDLCGIDFGGPLIDERTGTQIGIFNDVIFSASGHSHQCHPDHDHPLLFTKVSAYRRWIDRQIGNSGYY